MGVGLADRAGRRPAALLRRRGRESRRYAGWLGSASRRRAAFT